MEMTRRYHGQLNLRFGLCVLSIWIFLKKFLHLFNYKLHCFLKKKTPVFFFLLKLCLRIPTKFPWSVLLRILPRPRCTRISQKIFCYLQSFSHEFLHKSSREIVQHFFWNILLFFFSKKCGTYSRNSLKIQQKLHREIIKKLTWKILRKCSQEFLQNCSSSSSSRNSSRTPLEDFPTYSYQGLGITRDATYPTTTLF